MRQDIDQHWLRSACLNQLLALFLGARALHECHVSSGIKRSLESLHALVECLLAGFAAAQMLRLSCISARDDDEVWISPGFDGTSDSLKVDLQIDDILALQLSASFREHLVFDVQSSDTSVLIELHCAPDVERASKSSVCIGNDR